MLARSTLLLAAPAAPGSGRQRLRKGPGSRRAYDGIDNAAMGIQLSMNDPRKSRRSGNFAETLHAQQPQLYADYSRRSLTAESDATSTGRGRGDVGLPSTTPVGSYINGVLGGSLHPGLVDGDDDELEGASANAAAAAAQPSRSAAGETTALDDDSKSPTQSAGEAVVRLRAENARLTERLRGAEQRLRQSERERADLALRAAGTTDELAEAREELRAEQRLSATFRRQLESQRADGADRSESPTASRQGSLDSELERANQRASRLERSLQEMQRRLLLAESRPAVGDDGGRLGEELEAPPAVTPSGHAAALAVGAMSQAVADLRADAEALRRRAARDELDRRRLVEEAEERAADGERASEEALLSVSLGLESAKVQNAQLRRLLERSEAERAGQGQRLSRLQDDLGRLQESQSGWEAWAEQVAAGREDVRQLGAANEELRSQLGSLESGLARLQAELQAARSDAARRSERCRRLADEVERARQSEAKSARTAAAAAATLGRAAVENRSLRRRLGAASEAAAAASAPVVARQLRDLAESLRTDFQVAGSESDSGLGDSSAEPRRRSTAQLASLIDQIDQVEARGDSLMALKRRQVQEMQSPELKNRGLQNLARQQQQQQHLQQQQQQQQQAAHEDKSDVQRLLRMLLYNSGSH